MEFALLESSISPATVAATLSEASIGRSKSILTPSWTGAQLLALHLDALFEGLSKQANKWVLWGLLTGAIWGY